MGRTAPTRPCRATSRPASWGGLPGHDADIVEEDFAQEDHPGHAGERPSDENERHRQFGQLGFLIPAEFHEFDAPIDEHQREDQDEQVRNDLQHRAGFLYDRFVSETADLWFGATYWPFFSALEIRFPATKTVVGGDSVRTRS